MGLGKRSQGDAGIANGGSHKKKKRITNGGGHLQLLQIFFCSGMMMGLGKRTPNSISNGGEYPAGVQVARPTFYIDAS